MSALSGRETEPALENEEYIYFPSSEEITTITNGFCGEVLVNEQYIYFPSSDEIEYFENIFFYKGRRDEIVYDMMLCNGLGKKCLVRARNILTAANLLTPELESLYKAAEAAIFVIAGKPTDPWAPAIIAIIAFGLNECEKMTNPGLKAGDY